ncbi:uncharacterized protein LOC129751009 [Uranotaenia lowii]|uniref:uncharacterized protein LOC129751009 n=1 Tax=Uranotaenia lowii TaxID=190385 RepID=UPI002478D116|nr:uncharacterized protein LOC129751009 [Uranotaenia lowii]
MTRLYAFLAVCLLLIASAAAQFDCNSAPPGGSPKICCPWMDGASVHNGTAYLVCWEKYAHFPVNLIPGGGIAGGPAGCAAECFFDSVDALDRNQRVTRVDLNAMKAHVRKFTHPDELPVMDEALEYCVSEANARAEIFYAIQRGPQVVPGLENCSPISGFTFSCLHVYAMRTCPFGEWNPEGLEICDETRDFYNACPLNPY